MCRKSFIFSYSLAVGDVFGSQLISLCLLDTPTNLDELSGVAMEITDMASPTVESVRCTSSVQEAFQSASVVFVLDLLEKRGEASVEGGGVKEGGEREGEEDGNDEGEEKETGKSDTSSDLAEAVALYHKCGATLDFYAQKSVRVIVSGRLSNLGASVIARSASSLSPSHIVASPCLAEQRSKSIIAGKLGLNAADVEQVSVSLSLLL